MRISFVEKGFCDWKHALERLRSHELPMEYVDTTFRFGRRQWRSKVGPGVSGPRVSPSGERKVVDLNN